MVNIAMCGPDQRIRNTIGDGTGVTVLQALVTVCYRLTVCFSLPNKGIPELPVPAFQQDFLQ